MSIALLLQYDKLSFSHVKSWDIAILNHQWRIQQQKCHVNCSCKELIYFQRSLHCCTINSNLVLNRVLRTHKSTLLFLIGSWKWIIVKRTTFTVHQIKNEFHPFWFLPKGMQSLSEINVLSPVTKVIEAGRISM